MTETFTAEAALQQLETLLPPEALKPATRLVFLRAWEGEGYSTIATTIGYDETYVKRLAAALWRELSAVCGVKITKKNARLLLPGIFEQQQGGARSTPTTTAIRDWGAAPTLTEFYGRTAELEQLQTWVNGQLSNSPLPKGGRGDHSSSQITAADSQYNSPLPKGGRGDSGSSQITATDALDDSPLTKGGGGDRARLIALLGMGGIGKTALAVKLAQELQADFDVIVWRSLRNAPPLPTLLTDLTLTLIGQQALTNPIPELLRVLRDRRCLIILDNLETLLQAGKTGFYRPGYEDYGDLLRTLGEVEHQGCVVLTSREKPPEVAALEGQSTVQTLMLSGAPEAAQGILMAKGIQGEAKQKMRLANLYGNSPLALKIVATSIQDLFQGDITAFLAQETTVFNGIRRLLDEQLERLNPLEIQIMTWLALNRDWTTPDQLQRDIVPPVARSRILEALESLAWRSLLETTATTPDTSVGCYSQQPVVMEYVTDTLIAQIYEELITLEGDRFSRYPLTQTHVSEALRQSQVRLIISPLVALLQNTFPTPRRLEQHLRKVLNQLRENPCDRYGAGNLLDMYAMLGMDLTGYDLSELVIRQTDLSQLRLHNVNLSQSHCQDVVFLNALGAVIHVAYHPGGEQIATGDSQGLIKLWRVQDGQLAQTLPGHQAFVTGLAFSADGHWLASLDMDRVVKIWQLATGRCTHSQQLLGLYPQAIALSADGQQFGVGTVDGTVEIWSWAPGVVQRLMGHTKTVHSLCWQTTDTHPTSLWSASHDGTIRQWQITDGTTIQTLTAQGQSVLMISLSADGATLLSQGSEGAVQIWDTATGECRQVWSHPESTGGIAWLHPQGDRFAITTGANVQLWDGATNQPLQTFLGHRELISALAFSPDGQTLVSASQKECAIFWSVATGDRLRTVSGFVNEIWSLAWFPTVAGQGSGQLVSGHTDGYLRVWDTETRSLLRDVPAHEGNIFRLAWSPDGQLLATGDGAGQLKLWDAQVEQCLQTHAAHAGLLWGLAWRPDGQQLATGGADRLIKLWDTSTGTVVAERPAGTKLPITRLAWSPDGQLLAIASLDFKVHIWDLTHEDYDCIYQGQQSWVLGLAWTADSQTLALTGDSGQVWFWERDRGLGAEPLSTGQPACWSVQILANGQVLTGSETGEIQLWARSGTEAIATLTGHHGPVAALALSADQRSVASSSHDGTIRLWDLAEASCVGVMQCPRPYEGLKIEGLTGLTVAQHQALTLLGAVE